MTTRTNPRGGLLATNETHLYVRSMGRIFEISGLFDSDESCNAWLSKNPDHGVIACAGHIAMTAHLYTKGEPASVLADAVSA